MIYGHVGFKTNKPFHNLKKKILSHLIFTKCQLNNGGTRFKE